MNSRIMQFKELIQAVRPQEIINAHSCRDIRGFSIDSRTLTLGECFIAIKGVKFDGHDFIDEALRRGAGVVVSERNCASSCSDTCSLIVDDTIQAMARITRYLRKQKNPSVVAITGSVGKTTTKEMVAGVLKGQSSLLTNRGTENNIFGLAKTLFQLRDERILILELGTNHPGEIGQLTDIALPDVGVIMFIKPVHLEGLRSSQAVFREKISLLKDRRTLAVLNGDDAYLRTCRRKKVIWFGRKKENDIFAQARGYNEHEACFLINGKYRLRLKQAPFFIYNALAAAAVGVLRGEDLKDCVDRLNDFDNFPCMRMERVRKKGFTFINDAYNSNPFSLKEALRTLRSYPEDKIGIIGDMKELGVRSPHYHRHIAPEVMRCNFKYVLTIGEHTPYLQRRLKDLGHKRALHFSSCDEVVQFIKGKLDSHYLFFLKGSRVMRLEKIIQGL